MKVLLMGGTGAMGADLIPMLVARGDTVDVTSRENHLSSNPNLRFIKGNAREKCFIKKVLDNSYDAVVDFMVYTTVEFKERVNLLCGNTKQYLFLSSSRVYADTNLLIGEDSPRLLDVCNDQEYLQTDEYALAKARQENVLRESAYSNWTIIRPYITYNVERLQLGGAEKEKWLYRALKGKKILFFRDILDKKTTMTFGQDVAKGIAGLIGNSRAMGESFHITSDVSCTWAEILNVYLDTIEKIKGKRTEVILCDSYEDICRNFGNVYQVRYDRRYDRVFDNTKIKCYCPEITFIPYKEGLTECLNKFIYENRSFMNINWSFEGYVDSFTRDKEEYIIEDSKDKLKYWGWRYMREIMALYRNIRGN